MKRLIAALALLLLMFGVLGPTPAAAISYELSLIIPNPAPADFDRFGEHAVDAVGSMILVGARWDDTGATDAGTVYSFDGSTGELLQVIPNPMPAYKDYFGGKITALGNHMAAAAENDDEGRTNAGAVYLYELDGSTWVDPKTYLSPSPATYDSFGRSLALMEHSLLGKLLVVGEPMDNYPAENSGAFYVFSLSDDEWWRIDNPYPEVGEFFGIGVAGLGDRILAGGHGDSTALDDTSIHNAGAAFLFEFNEPEWKWDLYLPLLNPDPDIDDHFGLSVANVGDNKALVGARGEDTGATNAGAAYLFDASTGALLPRDATLNPTPGDNDLFGDEDGVAAVGDNFLVGAGFDDDETGVSNAGAAYLFDGDPLSPAFGDLLWTFTSPTPTTNDFFGYYVAGMGDKVILSALGEDIVDPDTGVVYTDAGAVYVFDVPEPSTLVLLSIAAIGLLLYALRKRR